MAYKKIGIAGLEAGVQVNRHGVGFSFAYSGTPWLRFARWMRGSAQPQLGENPASETRMDDAAGQLSTPAPELRARVLGAKRPWYHTIDLGHGVVTPGFFDHRDLVPEYQLPGSLAGLRVLDVATFDGFWAFEFERRGAREVVALDLDNATELDWPPKARPGSDADGDIHRFGEGFAIAKEALGSRVQRVTCNVYDLAPSRYGMFDVVHAGDFLIHLNSPVRALQNIASVCRDYALISDVYVPELTLPGTRRLVEYRGGAEDFTWWNFSLEALEQMVLDAGFSRVETLATFKYGLAGRRKSMNHVVFKAYK